MRFLSLSTCSLDEMTSNCTCKVQHFCYYTGIPFEIGEGIQVIATPGHTADDVSVVVQTKDLGTVVVAGNLNSFF